MAKALKVEVIRWMELCNAKSFISLNKNNKKEGMI